MKRSNFFPTIILMSLIALTGCKGAVDEPDPVPDLTFKVTITDAESRTIDETLVGNVATEFAANGSLSSSLGLFLITAIDFQDYGITFRFTASEVEKGTYQFNQGQVDMANFANYVSGASYVSTSGSISLTKVDLYQSVGGNIGAADDYFVDGNFTIELEDYGNASNTITMTGEFSGLNIKAN